MIPNKFKCRRTLIALTGIGACVCITLLTKVDTSGAVALIVTSIAGANAAQTMFSRNAGKDVTNVSVDSAS